MDELDVIARLAEEARKESPSVIDVTERVMQRLSALEEPAGRFWPFAAIVSAATAAAFLLAMQAWTAAQDPIVELLSSIRTVMR